MKSLFDYDSLLNEVFYKCWHILEYIEKNPNMSDLDKEAIQATIMDALVTRKQIDFNTQSLDLEHLCIVDNLEYYTYEKHPNICGIPLWMKEEFRKKALHITGGSPISIFLAKPPSKDLRYCVYDPNTAVSSIFKDATFYNAIYNSPTRGIRIEEKRPFVEVDIDGILYLVDTLTKRILKSSWFKDTYDFEILEQQTVSKLDKKRKSYYQEDICEWVNFSTTIPFMLLLLENDNPNLAEFKYEVEQSKKYFPDEWKKYEVFWNEIQQLDMSKVLLKEKK